jgi:hypothetical protein
MVRFGGCPPDRAHCFADFKDKEDCSFVRECFPEAMKQRDLNNSEGNLDGR